MLKRSTGIFRLLSKRKANWVMNKIGNCNVASRARHQTSLTGTQEVRQGLTGLQGDINKARQDQADWAKAQWAKHPRQENPLNLSKRTSLI
jgi:hypothetical protein